MKYIAVIAASLFTQTSSFSIQRLKHDMDLWKDGYKKGSEEKYKMTQQALHTYIKKHDEEIEEQLLQFTNNGYSYYPINTKPDNSVFARLLYNKNKPVDNKYDDLPPLPPEYTAKDYLIAQGKLLGSDEYPSDEQGLSGSDESYLSYPPNS